MKMRISTEWKIMIFLKHWPEFFLKVPADIPRNSGYDLNCTAVFALAMLLDNHTVAE
jgi:hypothetical protein